jgi:hypothetical protein
MLVDLSVPLVGVGADGAVGVLAAETDFVLTADWFFVVTLLLAAVGAKLSIASHMPAMLNRTPGRLRLVMKPALEEECFFIRLLFLLRRVLKLVRPARYHYAIYRPTFSFVRHQLFVVRL